MGDSDIYVGKSTLPMGEENKDIKLNENKDIKITKETEDITNIYEDITNISDEHLETGVDKDKESPTPTKKYPRRKSRRTTFGSTLFLKTPRKIKETAKLTKADLSKIEVGVLKAECVVLKHSLQTLEQTILKQAETIAELKEGMIVLGESLHKKVSSSVEAVETRSQ